MTTIWNWSSEVSVTCEMEVQRLAYIVGVAAGLFLVVRKDVLQRQRSVSAQSHETAEVLIVSRCSTARRMFSKEGSGKNMQNDIQ